MTEIELFVLTWLMIQYSTIFHANMHAYGRTILPVECEKGRTKPNDAMYRDPVVRRLRIRHPATIDTQQDFKRFGKLLTLWFALRRGGMVVSTSIHDGFIDDITSRDT